MIALRGTQAGRSGALSMNNLVAPLTSLVRREDEVRAVASLVQRPEVRWVTLTGPGGVGKTRLALAVANELLEDFAHDVCFVSLAPVSDSNLVMAAIAQALGVWEAGDRPLLTQLQAYLRYRHLLLLLEIGRA